jgi:hypothetical protein
MIYNTDFKVKYHDIQEELLSNFNNKNNDSENEYSEEDILDVCNKLYKDEIASVFFAEDILDDKIDIGMKTVLDNLLVNEDFQIIFNELKGHFIDYISDDDSDDNDHDYHDNSEEIHNINLLVCLTLFSNKIFFITHKCICQQLVVGLIDNDLLEQLRENALKILAI